MKNLHIILLISLFMFTIGCKENEERAAEKEIPATNESSSSPELSASIEKGKSIYTNYCAACHLTSGKGIPNAFPPLDNSDWFREKREESISAVKHGLKGEIKVNGKKYNSVMLDLGLSDEEVVNVMNYIMNSWSNSIEPPVNIEEVRRVKK